MHDRFEKRVRKRLIIQSAKEVFIDKGYNGATTQELARKANISEVTLFRYFPSKSDLFHAVMNEAVTTFERIFEKEKIEFALRPLLEDRIRYVLENQNLIKLILIEKEINSSLVRNIDFPEKILYRLETVLQRINISGNKREPLVRMISGFLISLAYFPPGTSASVDLYTNEIMQIIECFKKLP